MPNETLGASFSIDTTDLKAGLSQANRLIRESESEFKAAAAGMDDWTKKEAGLTAKIKSLNQITDLQQKKVNALQSEYDNLIANGLDPTSKEAVDLRTKINNETAAMEKNKKQASELEDALKGFREEAEKTGKSVDEVAGAVKEAGDNAEDAGDGFTTMKGAVATFAGNALTSLVDGLKNAVTGLFALSEETREYRNELAKLNTSFEMAGLSGDEAKKTFTELYGILGDEGAATEAAQQLAKISTSEKDLEANTRILTGVMAQYGNSIPLEGLAEGIAATSAMGTVQGVLADALEWQGINLDEYNEKLATLTTKEERAAYIQETLTGLYGASADAYLKNNEAVIKANKSQIEYNDTLAEMGEEMEPVNAEIQSMKNEFMKELVPVLKKDVLPAISKFIKSCKENKVIEKVGKAIGWLAENFREVASGVLLAVAAWKTMAIVTTVTTAIKGATTAMGALNAVMAANPIGAVVTVVMSLVAALSLLTDAEEENNKVHIKNNEQIKESIKQAREEAQAYRDLKQAADELSTASIANIEYSQKLWGELQTLADESGRVEEADKARAEFILGELNSALDKEYKMTGNVIKNYKQMQDEIYGVIEAKKAQILLEAYEDTYREAVERVAKAQTENAQRAQAMAAAYELMEENIAAFEARKKELLDNGFTEDQLHFDKELANLEEQAVASKLAYEGFSNSYKSHAEQIIQYNEDILNYETASTLVLQGETEKAIGFLTNLGTGFQTAATVAQESAEKQIEILKSQVVRTEIELGTLEAQYADAQESMTEEEKAQAEARIKAAKEQAKAAKDEYYKVGGDMVEGMARGAEDGEWTLTGALKETVNKGLKEAKKALGIKSPSRVFKKEVGAQISAGIAVGIDSGTKAVVKSINKQVNAMRNAYDVDGIGTHLNAVKSDFVALGTNTRQNANNGTGAVATGNGGLVVNQYNNYKQAYESPIEKYKSKQQLYAVARQMKAGAF